MATNLNYNVGVSTAQGVQALQNLQNKLAQTNQAFAGLKSAIAGIATAGFIASLYQSAAALKDVSDASGIGVQQLLGFQKAVKQFGGDAQGALDGVSKLSQAIDGAANGSKGLQDRFLELGIGLNDLRTLTETEILNKVIKSLGEGENNSTKMAAAIELFGKKFKNVNFRDVAANIDAYTEAQKRAASATEAADRAEENFGIAVGKFKSELLIALEPISKLAANLLEAGTVMKEFIRLAIEIGAVVLTFTLLGKIVRGVTAAFVGIGAAFKAVMETIAATGATLTSFGAILRTLVKNIPLLGAIAVAIGVIFGQVKDSLLEIFPSLRKDTEARSENADAANRQGRELRSVTDALTKEKAALDKLIEAYKLQNKEANSKFKLDTESLRLSEAQKVLQDEQLSAYNRYLQEFNKLQDQFNEKKLSGSASDKAMLPSITAAQNKLTAEYNKQKDAITGLVAERVKETQAKQLELFQTKSLIDSQNQLKTIQDNIAKSTMPEIERKYYDIDAAARASAKSAIEAEEARRNAKMPIEEQQQYYENAARGNAQLKAAAKEEYENSRRFSTGWTQAFNDYVDNATNAATQAQRIFQTFTQSMEDMLVNLFKTGKLGWKDFLQSMIDMLLRSQIQQLMAKTFSIGSMGGVGGGGRGGLFGGAIIPGFLAEGGPAGANKPYIVGERGPELFVPNTSGTVVPNNALGGGGNVTYNINAVDAMSFKQMLAADPTFLHAVAEQGRRRLPGVR